MGLSQLFPFSNTVLWTYGVLGLQDLNVIHPNRLSSTSVTQATQYCPKVLSSSFRHCAQNISFSCETCPMGDQTERPLPCLPQEIHDMIIDFLHSDITSLQACLLVCKAWSPAARYHIYDSFRLNCYNVSEGDVENALQTFQKIHQWHIGQHSAPPDIRPLSPHSRIPRRLSIIGDRCSPISEEWLLPLALRLHQFPSVTNLELDDIEWEDVLASRAWAVFTGRLIASRSSSAVIPGFGGRAFCEQITSVFLGNVDMKPFRPLRDVITAFPRLEKLELFPTYVANDFSDSDPEYDIDASESEDESEDEDRGYGSGYPYGPNPVVQFNARKCSRNQYVHSQRDQIRPAHTPPSSLHTFIAEASPGEFILRPFFRWLTSASFSGLKTIRLGVIGRNDIKVFVEYLEVVGAGLKELSMGFDSSSGTADIVGSAWSGRLGDLELFISHGGFSKNTGLVTLEIDGLFEARGDHYKCDCWPVQATPAFLRTVRSLMLESLVFSITRSLSSPSSSVPSNSTSSPATSSSTATATSNNGLMFPDRWASINSILSDTHRFPNLRRIKFYGPHSEVEADALRQGFVPPIASRSAVLTSSNTTTPNSDWVRKREKAFHIELSGVVRKGLPGFSGKMVVVHQGLKELI